MQTWAWRGSGVECYCGLCENKGDFVPLACPSTIVHTERNVLRLYLWRQRCWGWHLVTQGQWPAVPADHTPCCSPGLQHNVSGGGQHLGEGCLKDVGMEVQGQKVSKVFHPAAFQISAPAQNWSTYVGNHSNFQCEAGEWTFQYEMWLSGLLLCVKDTGPSRCC